MAYTISKYYRNTLGLDLRVSDLLRDTGAATEAINVMYRQTGALSKRTGQQIKTDLGTGGAGLVKFNNIEIGTGVITQELLSCDDNLHQYTDQAFAITYTGGDSAFYDLYLDEDTATYKFDLYETGELISSTDLGSGQGASDTTVAELKVIVDAIAGFSTTITDTGSTPAAFLDIGRSVNLGATAVDAVYHTWEEVPTPALYVDPFTDHWAIRNNTDFEIASFAQAIDVLYIANGYSALHKYDGNRVFKAGLPRPAIPTASSGSGGSLSAGDYKWKYTYETTDAKQNILQSRDSEEVEYTAVGSDSRTISMEMLASDSGYNIARAVVNGAQSSVNTITVDSGHDILVDDQVYIKDSTSGEVVKRGVTAVTSTTITVDGTNIDVADNQVISPVKISLWRTKTNGTIFYLVDEFIHDWSVATISLDDGKDDADLLIDFIPPVKIPSLPPICRYIDVWRNQLVMTGNREDVNTVYYSDFDIESFPVDQSFITESRLGGGNSGIKSLDNSLFIFKPRSIITCTGDLGTDQFQVDGLADDGVGCVANATIQEIEGVLWFLGKRGVYTVNRQGYVDKSDKIEPKFDLPYSEKRAVAFYWIERDMYVLQLPSFLEDGSSRKYTDLNNTFIMVHDLYREAWLEWNNINMVGGAVEYNGEIYATGFSQDPVALNTTQYIWQFLNNGTRDDYADHTTAIPFSYKSHWEAAQSPSVYKKFLRIKVHALDGTIRDFETDSFSIDISTEHDYSPVTEAVLTLDFSGGAQGWGASPWGQFIWGESRLEQLTSKLSSKKAKALRVIMENSNLLENVLISGYELEVAMPFDQQIKE